jgi:hypothetical protein
MRPHDRYPVCSRRVTEVAMRNDWRWEMADEERRQRFPDDADPEAEVDDDDYDDDDDDDMDADEEDKDELQ